MGVLFEIQDTTLCERVDELIRSHTSDRPLLHSMPMHTAIAELISRNSGLEEAIREMAREVEHLAAAQRTLGIPDN